MSKDSSVKHYQENKERLQKKLVKDTKVSLKKNKKSHWFQVSASKLLRD